MTTARRRFLLIPVVMMGYLLGSTRHINIGLIVDQEVHLESVSRIVDRISNIYRVWGSKQGLEMNTNITWVVLNSTSPGQTLRIACGMVNKGIQVLVTGLRCSQSRTVSAVTERFQIPHLSVDLYPCPPVVYNQFTLHLTTQYKTLTRVLVDVVKASGWRHVGLGFSHILDYAVKQEILVQLSFAGIQSVLLNNWRTSNMTDPSTNTKIFFMTENVDMMPERIDDPALHLALSTSGVVVQDMLPVTRNSLLTGKSVTNNVVLVNPMPVNLCLLVGLNWPVFRRFLTVPEFRFLQSVMMFSSVSNDLAKSHTNEDAVRTNCSAENKQPYKEGGKFIRELQKMCGYGKTGYCKNLNLSIDYDLYVIPAGSDGRVISIGEWTEGRGLTIHKTAANVTYRLFTNKLYDVGGVTLRIGVHGNSPPFSKRGNTKYHGIAIDMLEDLATELNFRYTIEEPADNLFGVKLDNGSWSGIFGMFQRGEIDIGVGMFSVTNERAEVVDFTTALIHDGLAILAPRPVEAPYLFQIFKPFSLTTWSAILAAVLGASVVFAFVTSKSSPAAEDNSNEKVLMERSMQENMFLIISSYFEQGPTFHPSSVPARCFLTFWFIFTVLTMTMYTAHLAAVLTVSSPVKPIDTLEDLAERTDLQIYVREATSAWNLFANSKKPVYTRFASRIVSKKDINTYLPFSGEGEYCVIGVRSYLQHYVTQSCGKARLGKETFMRFPVAFLTAKHSPYKNAIDAMLQKMVESGIIDNLFQKSTRLPTNCSAEDSNGGVVSLGLNVIGGIFIVYGTVTLVAVVVLLVELLFKYRWTRHRAH